MSGTGLSPDLEAVFRNIGAAAQTVERDPLVTVVPPPLSNTASRQALKALEVLSERSGERLSLDNVIGKGGMGVVRLGTQLTLGRQVAVKTLRSELRNDQASTLKLLREGWVTGALEHPNVIPVHDVQLDETGSPMVIFKCVEGVQWADLMHDAGAIEQRFGSRDALGWNLQILMQVCNAVSFAHSRGIVHRDVKPENVMIGAFGEVYLVDWGIAVSLLDDESGRLPLASDEHSMAGTPCYMAPEMLGRRDMTLSERTDIYLLGAILYDIVTGSCPHRGATAMAVVYSIIESEPRLDKSVPEELASIVRKAMQQQPGGRYASADEFRQAISDFLLHRNSNELTEETRQRLAQLTTALAGSDSRRPDEQRLRTYKLFGECGFGFREALRMWPDNPGAKEGLRQAIQGMIGYELSQGDPGSAAILLAQLEEQPQELSDAVAHAQMEKAAEEAKLASLRTLSAQLDPNVGRRARQLVGGSFVVVWLLSHLLVTWLADDIPEWRGHLLFLGLPLAFLGIIVGAGWRLRHALTQAGVNRRLAIGLTTALSMQAVLQMGDRAAGVPLTSTVGHHLLLWAMLVASTVVPIDRRVWPVPTIFVVVFVALSVWPEYRVAFVAMADMVTFATLAHVWGRFGDSYPSIEKH